MKKILLVLSIVGLTACDTFTVENSLQKSIKVNGILMQPYSCSEFVDFFNLFGDFPLSVTDEKGGTLTDMEYEPANYKVGMSTDSVKPGKVFLKEMDQPCEVGALAVPKSKPTAPVPTTPTKPTTPEKPTGRPVGF